MQKITLIRHAKTKDNAEKRFSGKMESEVLLTQEEIRKILLPKISLSDMGRIYSSPSKRAIFTAQAFSDEIAIDDQMREIDFGLFDGMTLEEIYEKYPEEFDIWASSKHEYRFPQGDRIKDFYERVSNGLLNIIDRSDKNENITLFTHGGVIQSLISFLLVKSNDLFWNFKIENCSVTRFSIDLDTVIFEKINC